MMDKDYLYQIDIREWIERGLDADIMVPVSGNKIDKKYDIYLQSFLLPLNEVENDMENDTYNAHTLMPGITVYGSWEDDEKVYHRWGNDNGYEPLVIKREYNGVATDSIEIVEEFRLLFNLYFNSQKNEYIDVSNGEGITVVKMNDNGYVTIHKRYLKTYLAVKEKVLMIHIDSRCVSIDNSEKIKEDGLVYRNSENTIFYALNIGNTSTGLKRKNYSIIYAKNVVSGCSLCDSNIWPYNEEKTYVDFIIGIDENGKEIRHTCNPKELNNYFGANPTAPHYLTPVYFDSAVLNKYYSKPEIYKVEDGIIRCGVLWSLYIDNSNSDYVSAYLGDLGRDLPSEAEQHYWRGFNKSIGGKLSKTKIKRDFMCIASDSESPDFVFKKAYTRLNRVFTEKYGCGTGGMLSTSYNFIKRYNPTADVRLFGQEINPESYAICLAEMLIKGQNAENICYQDTMKKDRFAETKMRFVIENPPFGTPWGGKDAAEGVEKAVNDEYAKGFEGRWGAGLPGSGDMQMLFLQSAIDKMDDNFGRAAIIENGSPLFSGGTASGESQIRRWMLENDLIEAIIALPTDLFYNTGIATYIWVLSKNKRAERKGKIQLIDASSFFHKLRKALGDKKNEISPEDRSTVTKLYAEFAENEYCKIYDNEEFIYREYTVMQPLQRSYAITEERIEAMLSKGALSSLYDQAKVNELENAEELTGKEQKKLESFQNNQALYDEIITTLKAVTSEQVYNSPTEFMPVLTKALASATSDKKLLDKIANGLSIMDKNAEIQRDRKGRIIYDKETKDTELVKWEESIEDYMAREVLPHIPDAAAFFEEDLGKKKPVIKTGAEIPFTRYFYKYQASTPSEELETKFMELEFSVSKRVAKLFE